MWSSSTRALHLAPSPINTGSAITARTPITAGPRRTVRRRTTPVERSAITTVYRRARITPCVESIDRMDLRDKGMNAETAASGVRALYHRDLWLPRTKLVGEDRAKTQTAAVGFALLFRERCIVNSNADCAQ